MSFHDIRDHIGEWFNNHGLGVLVGSVTLAVAVVTATPIGLEIMAYSKQKDYLIKHAPLCERVMGDFDSNKNGMLDPSESLEMTRAVGYDKTFPTNNPIVSLSPGDYSNRSAILTLSSAGSVADIGGKVIRPVWFEQYEFPLSRLTEIAYSRSN